MDKLYYTIDKEVKIEDDYSEVTGNKIIYVYSIIDNRPKCILDINASLSDNSEELIKEELSDDYEHIKYGRGELIEL